MSQLWRCVTTLYFTFCFRLDWLVEGTGLLDSELVADRLGDGSAGSICSCPSVERGVPVTGATRGKLIFSTVPVNIRGFIIPSDNLKPYVEPLLNLFWTSGNICPGFQSQGGAPCLPVSSSGVTPADLLGFSKGLYWYHTTDGLRCPSDTF